MKAWEVCKWSDNIREYEVDHFTEKMVFLYGYGRSNKRLIGNSLNSEHARWFKTEEEAVAYLLDRCIRTRDSYAENIVRLDAVIKELQS